MARRSPWRWNRFWMRPEFPGDCCRANTPCCGAGGAQLFIADDTHGQDKGRVNQLRFAQLAETGASTVVVACPYCPIMIRDAANHAKRDDIEILDLAEVVAKSIRRKTDTRENAGKARDQISVKRN